MLCAFFKPIIKFFKNPLIYVTLRNKDCTHETCVLTLQTRGKKRYDNVMLKLECKKNPLLTKYMKVNSPYRWLVQKYCSKFIGSLHDFFQGGWTPVQLKIFLQLKWKKYLHKKNHLKINHLEVVDYILWETIKFDTPFSISNPKTTCKNPNALPTPIRNHMSKTNAR